ncbi:glycoside hydrolase family 15 protein [Actinopolymorpha sp. NPDC004070]|uniref:glycoside hydrolase family 15 protein n=1 Tax=Actinopolymorpha sp. NPDC004070 TaxID=3154548 RepID=UPI0033B33109
MSPTPYGCEPTVLREYALIADGERGALCGPRGELVWLCAPGWDDDAVLSDLVGGGGAYAVTPTERHVWGGHYEPGSLIWRNRWVTTSGIVECRDALAFPGDPHRTVVLRRIESPEGTARVRVVLDLRAHFGQEPMRDVRRTIDGRWTARTGPLWIRWTGAPATRLSEDGRLELELTVPGGDHRDLVLEISDRELPEPVDPDQAWARTEREWRAAVPEFANSVAPRDARHAYALLRGLTAGSGAMVAAATLGLPERAEAGRNYDYRYAWIRDQCYAGIAVGVDGPHPLLDDAVKVTTARLLEHGDRLAPGYRADGSTIPRERQLHLPGYPGGADIVGNWVNGQFQLDAFGEILQLLAVAAHHDRLDDDGRRALHLAVDVIERRWDRADAGIWELREDWWTHSRLACVAGLRATAGVVTRGESDRLTSLADAILRETSNRCTRPDQAWRRSPHHDGTDAALLLPPVRGALPADDPRVRATIAAVEKELTQDGYAYRFAPDEDVPLGENEGAFLLCGFELALAYWHQGRVDRAGRWFERNRAACGPPGLFAEEYDVRQRQLRGNLPQAFVHAMFLETSLRLAGDPRWSG